MRLLVAGIDVRRMLHGVTHLERAGIRARHVSVKPGAKRPVNERAAPVPVQPTPCTA